MCIFICLCQAFGIQSHLLPVSLSNPNVGMVEIISASSSAAEASLGCIRDMGLFC